MTAQRRRFLLDMAWPMASDLLCHMFGLIDASPEVSEAEQDDSAHRMQKLASDKDLTALLVSAASDAAEVLGLVSTYDERVAWLTTYSMAVLNLLEAQGMLEVAA